MGAMVVVLAPQETAPFRPQIAHNGFGFFN
jgi:hypothetical protein